MLKTVEEILESARDIYGDTEEGQRILTMLMDVQLMAKREERARLIYLGEQFVGMYIDGPMRDSAYAIFDHLRTVKL